MIVKKIFELFWKRRKKDLQDGAELCYNLLCVKRTVRCGHTTDEAVWSV